MKLTHKIGLKVKIKTLEDERSFQPQKDSS